MKSLDPEWWENRHRELHVEIGDLERKRAEIDDRLKVTRYAAQTARRRAYYLREEKVGGGNAGHDEFWVKTSQLAPHINNWLNAYTAEWGRGGQVLLAKRSDVNWKTIAHIKTQVRQHTTLAIADKLLQAMGLTHLLDNEIEIVDNTTMGRWALRAPNHPADVNAA